MIKNLVIYVEGDSDKKLLEFLLSYWNITIDKILLSNGYTNLNLVAKDIKNYNKKGIKVLVLFDADSSDSNDKNNGFKNKTNYLNSKKIELSIEFETYLFPNNENDGDLEFFIRNISKYKELYDCWDNLWLCVKNKETKEQNFSLEGSKTMLYYYIARLFENTKPQIEEMKKYQSKIDFSDNKWEIEKSEYALKLKNFIEKLYICHANYYLKTHTSKELKLMMSIEKTADILLLKKP